MNKKYENYFAIFLIIIFLGLCILLFIVNNNYKEQELKNQNFCENNNMNYLDSNLHYFFCLDKNYDLEYYKICLELYNGINNKAISLNKLGSFTLKQCMNDDFQSNINIYKWEK